MVKETKIFVEYEAYIACRVSSLRKEWCILASYGLSHGYMVQVF